MWGREALHATAAELPGPFDDLLDLAAVDELLSRRGLRTPFLRLARDGAVIPTARFTRPGGVGAEIGDQVDDAAVARLFADGATIVLQALHRIWPPVIDFASELGTELGHPVQVNAYVTPPSSRGFSAHYDIHDVFVLQVAGEKRWVVHEPVLAAPLRSQPWMLRREEVARAVTDDEPVLDVVLRAGDALYLPRGFLHAAEALGDVSAHLTVGIHVVTRHALVQALVALADEQLDLRASLPVHLDLDDEELLDEEIAATAAALVAHLETVDPARVAETVRAALATAMRPAPVSPLVQVAASETVTLETRVRLRSGLRVVLSTSDGTPTLAYPTGTLDVDAASVEALRVLVDGEPHGVAELPGDDDAVFDLVRRLLAESIVVPVAV